MVNEEMVRNTIQKMRDAGLSEGIIQSTLADLGITPQQVQAFLVRQNSNGETPTPGGASASFSSAPQAAPRSFSMSSTGATSPTPSPAPTLNMSDHEAIASLTNDRIQMGLMQDQAQRMDENALKDNITHLALEQHGQQLMDTHQSVMELHDKLDASNLQALMNKINTIQARMENVSRDTQELRALSSALQSLMQKILETNQQLVFELKKK